MVDFVRLPAADSGLEEQFITVSEVAQPLHPKPDKIRTENGCNLVSAKPKPQNSITKCAVTISNSYKADVVAPFFKFDGCWNQ